MRFELNTPTRIIFGQGVLKEIGALAKSLGQRVFVVAGKGAADPTPLIAILHDNQIDYQIFLVDGEPSLSAIEHGTEQVHDSGSDLLIGFGGGSVMDTAKAISGMATNPGELRDYLEVIGRGKTLSKPGLPVFAIPTTSGTGAEVTRNAVLTAHEERMKVSIRSPYILPKLALVDPELTVSVPPAVTASTGMDALVQLIEPFVTPRANPITDAFCRDGIARAARSLAKAYQHGDDRQAREDMALASLLGGLALANAGLGAVHGFASPIGGLFNAPHGAICARLLAPVMRINIKTLLERQPGSPAVQRYLEVAQLLTGNPSARVEDGIQWAEELCQSLAIPDLSSYGITPGEIPMIVSKAIPASSMQANPIKLTEAELMVIMEMAL